MATNFYFQSGKTIGATSEQRLVEDLIVESIGIYGHDVYYLPRTLVKKDMIFGEDVLSQFTQAIPVEMYIANVQGWDGMQEMFTKFGIEVRDKATFMVSKRRWEDVVISNARDLQLPMRPCEGDLLYLPRTDSMFEIKFVEHLDPFFQVGKFYVYNLQAEMFQYSSERVETGIPEIDDDFVIGSQDVLQFSITKQDGSRLLLADGGSIIKEEFDLESSNKLSNNTDFEKLASDIVDFSSINPFGEI